MIGNDAENVMKMRKNHRDPHYVIAANKIAVKLKRDPLCYVRDQDQIERERWITHIRVGLFRLHSRRNKK